MMKPAKPPTTPEALFTVLHGAGANLDDLALMRSRGSMTRALSARYGDIRVLRLAEGIGLPRPGEAALLRQPDHGGYWCREIALLARGQVRLVARSVVPPAARRLQRTLRHLGNRPLMDVLFQGDRLRYGVTRTLRLFGTDRNGHLCRLTLFEVEREPLLLIETLTEAIALGNCSRV